MFWSTNLHPKLWVYILCIMHHHKAAVVYNTGRSEIHDWGPFWRSKVHHVPFNSLSMGASGGGRGLSLSSTVNISRHVWIAGWKRWMDGWIDGGRQRGTGLRRILPGSTPPISQRGTLRVGAVFGRASVSYCPAGKKNIRGTSLHGIWGQQTELLSPRIIIYTLHASVLGFSFKYKDSLLSGFSLITLCFFSQKLESACYLRAKSPFMSVRGELKFPRAAAAAAAAVALCVTVHHKNEKKQR